MSGRLLAEDGARFTATSSGMLMVRRHRIASSWILPGDVWWTVTCGRSRRTPRLSIGSRWKLIGAASLGGNAFRSEQGDPFSAQTPWGCPALNPLLKPQS